MVDSEYLRRHYDGLDDEELQRLFRGDLVPEARAILEAEMSARGILPVARAATTASGAVNVYSPPKALLHDPDAPATITVSRLVRLFQMMVVVSTLTGLFVFGWPFLPLQIAQELLVFREQAGAGAISPALSGFVFLVLQPLWILSALGLCFFKRWARPLFIGTYLLSAIASLIGGLVIWLPWEAVLVTFATLIDGAVFVLAYLPPLSTYFAHDRGAAT
jgi:hypothetical protein